MVQFTEFLDGLELEQMLYGLPPCLHELPLSVLQAIPSGPLGDIMGAVVDKINRANTQILEAKLGVADLVGFLEVDTNTGKFRFKSGASLFDSNVNDSGQLNSLTSFLTTMKALQESGTSVYQNVTTTIDQVQMIQDCIGQFMAGADSTAKPNPGLSQSRGESLAAQAQSAQDFISRNQTFINNIQGLLEERRLDPTKEPIFNTESDLVTGLERLIAEAYNETIGVSGVPIFDLVFGPPVSKQGQFILSKDGMYYDSQTGGLPEVSGFINPGDEWKFDYAPNLGGKGVAFSTRDLNQYVDTIFDETQIDESPLMQSQYNEDSFLQDLIGQKNKHVYDVSTQVTTFLEQGYAATGAIVINLKGSIYAILGEHLDKINKRKKQIEIAVKAPSLFGASGFSIGEIPVNDFSYLGNLNISVALETQRNLTFMPGEVEDIVLPLRPKFVKAAEIPIAPYTEHIVVPPVGKGGIIFTSGVQDSSGIEPTILSLTDGIVTDGLIAMYNFLETNIVSPGATEFVINDSANPGSRQNAQLVAVNASTVFTSGLAIPHLEGMVRRIEDIALSVSNEASAMGSYVQLPDTKEFQDLTYNQDGFTIESWIYTPELIQYQGLGWNTSSFNRILLGCENIGGVDRNENPLFVGHNKGTDTVRGLLVGYSSDRSISRDLFPKSKSTSNRPTGSNGGLVFFIAPTRSVNASDVTYISKGGGCDGSQGWYACRAHVNVDEFQTTSGAGIGDTSAAFTLIDVVVDPIGDQVRMYADGQLIVASGINESFGLKPGETLNVPSLKSANSFEYHASSTGVNDFVNGPRLNKFFTPWIVGGGYTDGYRFPQAGQVANSDSDPNSSPPDANYSNGGFMGIDHGLESGLWGHIGSLKFYKKALDTTEVIKNFEAQKGFFKNIQV